jgi:hypothetical protein
MCLKTGNKTLNVSAFTKVYIECDSNFSVYLMDEEKVINFLGSSVNRKLKLDIKEDCTILVQTVNDDSHWALTVTPYPSPYEKVSPVPVEIPDEYNQPETLEQKMHRMMGHLMEERFGRNSLEAETFEDSMDFDIDDDSEPFSAYELQDMEEEYFNPEDNPNDEGSEDADNPLSQEEGSQEGKEPPQNV